MTNKLDELVNLLKESDSTTEVAATEADTSSEATLDAVTEAEIDSILGEDLKDTTEVTESQSDEISEALDPEISELLRLVEAEDEEDEEKEEEGHSEPDGDEGAAQGYNDVENVGLTDDEIEQLVAQSQEKDDDKDKGEEKDESEEDSSAQPEGDLPPLVGTEDLSQEQKGVLRRLFDDCVTEATNKRLAAAVRLAEAKLNSKFKAVVEARELKLNESVNEYLSYVVESWVKKNEVALRTEAQVKVAKKIFESVRSIVEMFDIETVDATASIVEMYEGEVKTLRKSTNDLVAENVRLSKELKLREKAFIIEEASRGLPLTEVEVFKGVVTKIKADDIETFRENVKSVRESFAVKPKGNTSIKTTNENLALQGGIKTVAKAPTSDADAIAQFLSQADKD